MTSPTRRRVGERERDLPVKAKTDVIICGGGPAGIMAAVAAARSGAKTLLVERYGFLGGMATAGMVGPMSKFRLDGEFLVGGIPWEFVERMRESGGAITTLPSGNVPFDVEIYMGTAREMVREAGVDVLLHALASGTASDKEHPGRITHAILETKEGRFAIEAGVLVDCTGTGDLVARSALPWKMRTSLSGELQPLSLVFHLGGVDTYRRTLLMARDGTKYRDTVLAGYLAKAKERGEIGNFGGPWALWGSVVRDGYVSVLATRYAGNAVDAVSLTDAELTMREEIPKIVEILRKNAPEFSNCFLARTAVQAGIRETRAIDGLYTMKPEDVLDSKPFPDTVAKGGHPVDIHLPDGSGGQDVKFIDRPYNIPFRSLVPRGSVNVLVAGGCLAADKEAFASIRVQAQCMATGQAAGTAAAICAKDGTPVGEVDGAALRGRLSDAGAVV